MSKTQGDSCPRCGARSRMSPDEAASLPRQREIEIINQELNRIDDQIVALRQERVSLGRRLNHLQSSTFILPLETLSSIFQHIPDPNEPERKSQLQPRVNVLPLIRLGAVCSLWRNIVWSSPSLWVTVIAHVSAKTMRSTANIIDLCLRNSGSRRLSLDIRFSFEGAARQHFGPKFVRPISDLIFKKAENAAKIGVLRLNHGATVWTNLLTDAFENLEELSLEGFEGFTMKTSRLPSLPRLTQLNVANIFSNIVIPSARNIVHLTMSNSYIDAAIGIFRQCVNLVECHLHVQTLLYGGGTGGSLPTANITFPHLSNFTWVAADDQWNVALLDWIRLPTLRQLRLAFAYLRFDRPGVPERFINYLPSTLRKVELDQWRGGHNFCRGVHQLIARLPSSISELSLINCSEDFVSYMVQELTPGQIEMKNLHLLEELRISAESKVHWSAIIGMVEKRRDGIDAKFRLVVPRPTQSELRVIGDLEALVHACAHLKIDFLDLPA